MKLYKIFSASVKMIFRDRIALFWALAFPLMFIALFGLFSMGMSGNNLGKLAWIDRDGGEAAAELKRAVADSGVFTLTEEYGDPQEAKEAMRNNKINFVLLVEGSGGEDGRAFPDMTLFTDVKNQSVNGAAVSFFDGIKRQFFTASVTAQVDYVLRLPDLDPEAREFYSGLKETLERSGEPVRQEPGGKNPVKYFDMVFVGLVCMGIMNYSVTGFAINLATMREQKILKRLLTTPLPMHRFMLGQILAFLLLAFAQLSIMLAVGLGFGARIYAGWWFLPLLVLLGALLFLTFGFFLAAFAKNANAASGMANGIAIPLMFLGGVFFPLEVLPAPFYQTFRFLPLAPMIQAMRSVCLEGDPVSGQLPRILIMLGWLVVVAALGLAFFRFSDE